MVCASLVSQRREKVEDVILADYNPGVLTGKQILVRQSLTLRLTAL